MQTQCKKCAKANRQNYTHKRKEYVTKFYATNITYDKERYANNTFGISYVEYLSWFDGASCGICGTSTNLVLDHDHTTGSIRGVLCGNCNSAIGMLGDSTVKVAGALAWLERFNTQDTYSVNGMVGEYTYA